MKFTAKKRQGALIGPGLHVAAVVSVVETESGRTKTPQLEVTFKTADGLIRKLWLNLRGYKKNASGQFVDAKGNPVIIEPTDEGKILDAKIKKRIEDEDATQKCMEIVGQLGADLGLDTDEEFGPEDMVERTALIGVSNDQISHVFHESKMDYAVRFMESRGIEVDREALVSY